MRALSLGVATPITDEVVVNIDLYSGSAAKDVAALAIRKIYNAYQSIQKVPAPTCRIRSSRVCMHCIVPLMESRLFVAVGISRAASKLKDV